MLRPRPRELSLGWPKKTGQGNQRQTGRSMPSRMQEWMRASTRWRNAGSRQTCDFPYLARYYHASDPEGRHSMSAAELPRISNAWAFLID